MIDENATKGLPPDDLHQELESELELSNRSLKEVSLMLEQSQAELSKLTQRNAAITSHLQQMQPQFENMPRADIKMAYNSALDAQQRLLVMRGQIEKLQTEQTSLQRYINFLEKVLPQVSEPQAAPASRGANGSAVLEMVIAAQEAERKRLSTLMHDGPAQALSNFIVQTEIASRLLDADAARAKDELTNLKNSAMKTFHDVRRFIFEIRPMMLDDLGLFPTLRRYVDTYKEQSGADINLTIKGVERRLESYLEVMIFRAVQELLANAVNHNQDQPSRLQVNVQINLDENWIRVAMADNGKGFDPEVIGKTNGLGLKIIRERVEMLGGTLEIDSALGKGSRITFMVPCIERQSI